MSLSQETVAELREVVRLPEEEWRQRLSEVLQEVPAADIAVFLDGVLAMGAGAHEERIQSMGDHLARGLEEVDELARRIVALTAEQRRIKAELDVLKAQLVECMGRGAVEVEGWRVALSRPRRRLQVDDQAAVPQRFLRQQVDSKAVLAAWDQGEPVPGTHIALGAPSVSVRKSGV